MPDPLLKRQLLLPTELQVHIKPPLFSQLVQSSSGHETYWRQTSHGAVERVRAIEAPSSAWKADIITIILHPHFRQMARYYKRPSRHRSQHNNRWGMYVVRSNVPVFLIIKIYFKEAFQFYRESFFYNSHLTACLQ